MSIINEKVGTFDTFLGWGMGTSIFLILSTFDGLANNLLAVTMGLIAYAFSYSIIAQFEEKLPIAIISFLALVIFFVFGTAGNIFTGFLGASCSMAGAIALFLMVEIWYSPTSSINQLPKVIT